MDRRNFVKGLSALVAAGLSGLGFRRAEAAHPLTLATTPGPQLTREHGRVLGQIKTLADVTPAFRAAADIEAETPLGPPPSNPEMANSAADLLARTWDLDDKAEFKLALGTIAAMLRRRGESA